VAAVRDLGATRSRSKVKVASPVGLSADLRRRLLVLGLFSPVNFSDTPLLRLLRAHDLGLSTGAVIGAYIVYNAVYAAASYPAGGLAECTDCVGKAWVASLAPADGQGAAQGPHQALTGEAVLVADLRAASPGEATSLRRPTGSATGRADVGWGCFRHSPAGGPTGAVHGHVLRYRSDLAGGDRGGHGHRLLVVDACRAPRPDSR